MKPFLVPFNVFTKPIYIALDDGHGEDTPGKRTPKFPDGSFMHENDFNKRVVAILKEELVRCGFKVLLVAPTDKDTPLKDRVKLANKEKVDFYLSIHANALKDSWNNANGIETFTIGKGEGFRVGKILHKYLMQGTKFTDRGMKDGGHLYVINSTNMPSALVECGFMDNIREATLLKSESYRRECAIELAKGLCEAYKVPYREVKGTSTPKPKPTPKPEKKEEVRMFKPSSKTLENEMIQFLEKARKSGAFTSKEHEELAKKGELSLDNAVGLLASYLNRTMK